APVDVSKQLLDANDQVPREALDEIRTTERIDGVCQAGLMKQDLLSPQRNGCRFEGGRGKSLVIGRGVKGLAAAHNGCGGGERYADNVIQRLLRGEVRTGSERKDPKCSTTWV